MARGVLCDSPFLSTSVRREGAWGSCDSSVQTPWSDLLHYTAYLSYELHVGNDGHSRLLEKRRGEGELSWPSLCVCAWADRSGGHLAIRHTDAGHLWGGLTVTDRRGEAVRSEVLDVGFEVA